MVEQKTKIDFNLRRNGRCKWFDQRPRENNGRGFGFITPDPEFSHEDGKDVFCHINSVLEAKLTPSQLQPDVRISYVLKPAGDGKVQATQIKLIEDATE